MRWETGRRSDNVEDRRGVRLTGRKAGTGGIGIIILALVGMYFGIDPSIILNYGLTGDESATLQAPAARSESEDRLADFVSVVLADTEDTWDVIFQEAGRRYEKPALVLFTGAVQSACGYAQSATGPFYCPADRKVYIDLGFYNFSKPSPLTDLAGPDPFVPKKA
jgi:predicted metalloprotease